MQYLTIDEYLKLLGEDVRAHRLGMNITQQATAARSGISLKALRNIEDGKNASMKSFVSVCRTLGKLDWIAALEPPTVTRDDFERFSRGGPTKRKRASINV